MSTRTLLFTDCVDFVGSACKAFAGMKKYVSTGAVDIDHINDSETEIIDYDGKPSRANLKVMAGDVLFAKMQGTKKTLLIDPVLEKHIYSTGFCAVRAKKAILTERCLYHILMSEMFLSQKDKNCSGATQKAITNAGIGKIVIHVPSIEEQNIIADQLDAVIGIITKRHQELSALDDLIKARFVEMFGDVSSNNKNWVCEPLGNLSTIVRGGSPRPIEQFLGGNIPWIKIGDATNGDNIYLNSTKEHIKKEGVKKSRLIKPGSLIFANCGVSLGFARIITFEGCIHDGWLAIENIDVRIDKVFLLHSLNQMTEHFRKIAPSGTQPNLNTSIMKLYRQIIPPIELQQEYIVFLDQVNKSKVAVQKALDQAQTLFDSLMQEYFG